jgi:hypothetical protein
MKSFFALVTPFDPSVKPDQGLPKPQPPAGGQPPKPDNTLPGALPHPEHPIYWPLPPEAPVDPSYGVPVLPGMEGGAPRPDQGLPGSQPKPDQGLPGPQPKPEHPIVLPPGGGNWLPVYIDNSLPGEQPGIDNSLPGSQPRPDNTLPGSQPKPDQGLPAFPSHPIVIPPDMPAPPEVGFAGTIKFKAIWTPANGWQTIGVIIPGGGGKPIPTPSTKR